LFEFVNFHSLSNIRIEDVFLGNIVAFFSDFLLSSNNLILNLQSSEAELAELFREIVWWNFNHSKI